MTFTVTSARAPRGSIVIVLDHRVVKQIEITDVADPATVTLAAQPAGKHVIQVVFLGVEGFANSSSPPLSLKVSQRD